MTPFEQPATIIQPLSYLRYAGEVRMIGREQASHAERDKTDHHAGLGGIGELSGVGEGGFSRDRAGWARLRRDVS
jgi:hypothetical protein